MRRLCLLGVYALAFGSGACSACSDGSQEWRVDAGAPQPSNSSRQSVQTLLYEAQAILMDPSADTSIAFHEGIRANFVMMQDLRGRFATDRWPAIDSLNEAGILGLSVTGAHRVRSRSGTRSCAGRPDCRGVAVTVRATNQSPTPVRLTLREEFHGGPLPPSSLVACARTIADARPRGRCAPAYLVEHAPHDRPDTQSHVVDVAPHATTTFDLRFDWDGTGSIAGGGYALVDPEIGGAFDAAVGVAFESGSETFVAYSDVARLDVPPP